MSRSAPPSGEGGGAKPPKPSRPKAKRGTRRVEAASQRTKKIVSFAELGWVCSPAGEGQQSGAQALAFDVGTECCAATTFEGSLSKPRERAHPTMVLVTDPHAFRSLEPFSLETGLAALERWPSERVLRGTRGSIQIPSQIGLVEFPADHALAGLIGKVRTEARCEQRNVVLTLPTFMSSSMAQDVRDTAAPYRKGAFRGVPGALASAYYYWAPALAESSGAQLAAWSRGALTAGQMLVLDWGASGLEYGWVTVRPGEGETKTELRLRLAGIWPSLGGHRLTLLIVQRIHRILTDRILAQGPSDDLIRRPLFDPRSGFVPRPIGYEEAFDRLRAIGRPANAEEAKEIEGLRNLLLPIRWQFEPGEEPAGYAPFRRLAVAHFKGLWQAAERVKRMVFAHPTRNRERGVIPWNADALDSPFVSDLEDRLVEVPVRSYLNLIQRNLSRFLSYVLRRVRHHVPEGTIPVALSGMQSASPLLREVIGYEVAQGRLKDITVAPASTDPLELKATLNRGAALLFRDKRTLDFGPVPEVLPFSIQIADCLGNVSIFTAGPLDELSCFQRRIRVEGGFPRFEFFIYESEDGLRRGSWGCIDFQVPFEFSESDQTISVDPRYGFGANLPTLRELRGDDGQALTRCFDREDDGPREGAISFRAYAPRRDANARKLLHFLENGLRGEFHRKVYLLEREFPKPQPRFDYIYQRYYLSRSQELLVVREWWAPVEGGKLLRNKTLHVCQGATEANTILGLHWGSY
ncbi:MAG: hypothetical protein JKY65_25325 [Planctomycetes bacterium]|nr:hypothetical protein [Planctomycetota bacterium]